MGSFFEEECEAGAIAWQSDEDSITERWIVRGGGKGHGPGRVSKRQKSVVVFQKCLINKSCIWVITHTNNIF